MPASAAVHLPRVLVTTNGRETIRLPSIHDIGILYRDIDLPVLLASALTTGGSKAVDLDTVRGLRTDDEAIAFVIDRLAVRIVMTRRLAAAERVAESGGLALLHTLAFDSTGVARILDSHPRSVGIGAVQSPGLVLPHMLPSEVSRLPRPLLAYGLIQQPSDALACLALADSVVLDPAVAAALAPALAD
jgi:glycerol-3-phosphate responsive antiterminator